MSSDKRCFFALTFADEAKSRLSQERDTLKAHADNGTFTHSENFHLTLEFIGDVASEQLPTLKGLLHELECAPMVLRIDRLGHFNIKGRQLVWLGVAEHPPLMTLQSELRMKLADTPFSPENRSYIPHITLGRHVVLNTRLKALYIEPFTLPVHSIALMESKRVDNKLIYEALEEVLLSP
ncbi:RNA 2',3'-cyclic phosphodiesterase [Vibrio fluvialis]|uniref:RNA 2',3'-cyclic phosphodiesterase n=1 Tax=Vibrio fluvialis TaxID=676 RepID=UPI00193B3523|nr:RNA 2',3'-cyclic phosphodiesterase [Vibrio fluvialis]MBY8020226.1 RNA 2',3'-cyclic phosphodiesterase [Vibrio fluvialis]MBY8278209.1 RNA 2',3'-cyclic phosphodiesterase [Vibrio fluvialis]HDM8047137.1 RNA 2',3'-cyclic phosphodiesterase [Vibrio fluvialis]HDM8051545.1 RNA 2',3'-cyclic phosphodiesterase [Vibrio fluvialis]